MMDLQAIKASVECHWSQEDEAFVVTSPLCCNIAGVEDTKEAAYQVFNEMLASAYTSFLQGKFTPRKRAGRKRSKAGKVVSIRLREELIAHLKTEAKAHNQTIGDFLYKIVLQKQPT